MAHNLNILDTIQRLGAAERLFLASRFLAPVTGSGTVAVRIAGVRCALAVAEQQFRGFGIFRPLSHAKAALDRPATLSERARYLQLFPAVSLILAHQLKGDRWLALAARRGDRRIAITGPVAVELTDTCELFQQVFARFDGHRFWFDQLDPQDDPATAAYLRQSMLRRVAPAQIDRRGLTPEQRTAYAAASGGAIESWYADLLRPKRHAPRAPAPPLPPPPLPDEERLRQALQHGGAELHDFAQRGEHYRVTYGVDGQRYTSLIRRGDLTVQSAGICLSGQDADFDLTSLVGVLREGDRY